MRWCLHTASYASHPPTSSNSFVSTIRFVNGPGVPSLHLMHNADNLVTLSATGIQSKISPNFSCLKSASRPASMTVFLETSTFVRNLSGFQKTALHPRRRHPTHRNSHPATYPRFRPLSGIRNRHHRGCVWLLFPIACLSMRLSRIYVYQGLCTLSLIHIWRCRRRG